MRKFTIPLLALLCSGSFIFEKDLERKMSELSKQDLSYCSRIINIQKDNPKQLSYGPLRGGLEISPDNSTIIDVRPKKFQRFFRFSDSKNHRVYHDYFKNLTDNFPFYREIYIAGEKFPLIYQKDLDGNENFEIEETIIDRNQDGWNRNERPFYEEIENLEKKEGPKFKI